jgi:hypothetical protein
MKWSQFDDRFVHTMANWASACNSAIPLKTDERLRVIAQTGQQYVCAVVACGYLQAAEGLGAIAWPTPLKLISGQRGLYVAVRLADLLAESIEWDADGEAPDTVQ